MTRQAPKRVREQVVVYLASRDRALLEQLAKTTGLAKTELFRRGLRRLAEEALAGVAGKPGEAPNVKKTRAAPIGSPAFVSCCDRFIALCLRV